MRSMSQVLEDSLEVNLWVDGMDELDLRLRYGQSFLFPDCYMVNADITSMI